MSISCDLLAHEIAYEQVMMWWWALLSRSQLLHLSFFNPGLTNTVAYDCQSGHHAHCMAMVLKALQLNLESIVGLIGAQQAKNLILKLINLLLKLCPVKRSE